MVVTRLEKEQQLHGNDSTPSTRQLWSFRPTMNFEIFSPDQKNQMNTKTGYIGNDVIF